MEPSFLVGTPCRLPLLPTRRSFLPKPQIVDRLPLTSIVTASRCFIPVLLAGPRAVTVSAEGAVGLGGRGEGEEGEGGDFQECEFVQVGYISSIHGIKGEVRVTPMTDFPEIRFCTPGIRWLKTRVSGKELISQVQLTGGRGHSGQKSWIVSFSGIDTVDKAKQIVGSTLLVKESDRPDLEEGEFYSRDLVGMRVALKESGTLVGIVTKVVNYGASDLLHVMLVNVDSQDWGNSLEPDLNSHVQHVWVPFVEAIVPDVDMDKGEMLITPPKGLLELNLRPDTRPKKERRQLEWKERKKLERRVAVAKRKLAEIGQTHVLEGLRIGEKAQKNLLARQIINIDFKMLQHAIQSINNPSKSFQEFGSVNSATSLKSPIRVSLEYLMNCASEEKEDSNYIFHKEGLQLLSKSKAAIVLIISEEGNNREAIETNGVSESSLSKFENVLLGCSKFWKVEEEDKTGPLIVVLPAHLINSYEKCLQDNNYFGMNSEKVWFLEELQLPIVSMPVDQNGSKILLKCLWELLEAPVGSGGFFRLMLSNNILAQLCEIGVDFVEVCSLNDRATSGHPLFFGLVSSLRADVGIKVFENSKGEEEFDMIFSMRFLNRIVGQVDKLQFLAVPEQHVHFSQDRNESVTRYPDAPNSYRFRCSIYSSLNNCSKDEICVMKIFE
ncbi:LOW QUALITY PROTEIN: uncharacterized protein LOC141826060 [Curcuma longa]|uniref:LOW QUALITY PROTEIN: uncharacterized protein LOC141826060 n=1 Tax=Curcuma longa TaxID=136217 RepID=UPI003D9E9472